MADPGLVGHGLVSGALRPELAALVDALVRDTKAGEPISLDAIGEAIGARAVSQEEIDGMLRAIEARGRSIASPEGGDGEEMLKRVLDAARVLRAELGRSPRRDEIAARAGLTPDEVAHALALADVIRR